MRHNFYRSSSLYLIEYISAGAYVTALNTYEGVPAIIFA